MLKIITTENPLLIKRAEDVKKFDGKLKETIDEMEETLINTSDPVGVGLAAPQVGISLRMFLARTDEKMKPRVFLNPVITEITNPYKNIQKKPKKTKQKTLLEGCLSIPNIWGNVTRAPKLTLMYQDITGKQITEVFTGFMATIIQHEVDHLNGLLFTKHVLEQSEKLYRSYKTENGEDEFEEIKL